MQAIDIEAPEEGKMDVSERGPGVCAGVCLFCVCACGVVCVRVVDCCSGAGLPTCTSVLGVARFLMHCPCLTPRCRR